MHLTDQQLQAATNGEPVQLTVDGQQFVLLRRDLYETTDGDDGPSSRTTAMLIREAMSEDDADDPTLGSYQQYKRNG